jgi:hypothetical protein
VFYQTMSDHTQRWYRWTQRVHLNTINNVITKYLWFYCISYSTLNHISD